MEVRPYYAYSQAQVRFVQEYLIDRNGAAAAVRAGYSQRTARQIAYELLARPEVAAAVQEGEARIAANAEVTREKVLTELLAAIDMARLQNDPMTQIAGWREIAKLCGYYAQERRQIKLSSANRSLRTRLETMSDAELSAIVSVGGSP